MVGAHRSRVALLMLVALFAAACGSGGGGDSSSSTSATPGSEPSKQGGTVRVALDEPEAIDPAFVQTTSGWSVARLLFEPLVRYDADKNIVPAGAESWDVSDDRTVYTLHLRDDLTFSNGQPVTAEDYAFEFRRVADPDTASPGADPNLPIVGMADAVASQADGIIGNVALAGVQATDPATLVVRTTEPYAMLMSELAQAVPVPANLVDSEAKAQQYAESPIGNGPYQMAQPWEHNVSIDLERNPTFTGTPGLADRIEGVIFAEAATGYREAQAGNIDISSTVPLGELASAKTEFGDRYIETASGAGIYIYFPLDLAPYDDVELRRAVSLAIDREALAERVLNGTALPGTNLVPDSAQGAKPDACPDCRYDPDEAKRVFDESTAAGITELTAYYPAGADLDEAAKTIGNDVRAALGVDVVFQAVEFGQLSEMLAQGIDGPYGYGWQPEDPSAYDYLAPQLETGSPANDGGYSNAEFDALMQQARAASSAEELNEALGDAQVIVGDELPIVPLVFPNLVVVHTPAVRNVQLDPFGFLLLEQVEVVR
jgi:oligopeptide transport system substrate-binding protein